jgi:hypothetical protein
MTVSSQRGLVDWADGKKVMVVKVREFYKTWRNINEDLLIYVLECFLDFREIDVLFGAENCNCKKLGLLSSRVDNNQPHLNLIV